MFKNEFQGGNFFEIFNPSIKDPLCNFKLTGPHGIQKIFDKEIKGSVYQLDGQPTTTKISIPKETKLGLSLVQRILVFQVNVKQNNEFSMEIGITDLSQNKRNLLFSTSHKELSIQPLSARIPFKLINRAIWTNLVFDLSSLINEIWKNQTFKSIEFISLSANCKLRKIFTLKNLPIVDYGLSIDDPLTQVEFPQGTECKIQIFNLNDLKLNENIENKSSILNDASLTNSQKAKSTNVFKIAFGTKVAKIPPITSNNQTNKCKENQSKTLNPLTDFSSEQIDHLNLSLKNTQISPLSMSNGHLSSTGANSNRKSLSDYNLSDRSNSNETQTTPKTTWNQRAAATKSAFTKPSSPNKSAKKNESQIQPISKQISSSSDTSSNEITIQKKLNSLIQTNKIPHPPPQSTRPATASARKIRLPNSVKINSNTQDLSSKKSITNSTNILLKQTNFESSLIDDDESNNKFDNNKQTFNHPSSYNKSNYSNESVLNESINDLIQILKSNQNNTNLNRVKSSSNSTNLASQVKFSEANLDDSGNTIVYSFVSKPKPVSDFKNSNSSSNSQSNDKHQTQQTSNKSYDHRKYTSGNISPSTSGVFSNKSNSNNQNLFSLVDSLNSNQNEKFTGVNDSNNNKQDAINENLMDSFEARMLQEMKAEMDSDIFKTNSNDLHKKNSSATSSAGSNKQTASNENEQKQSNISPKLFAKSPDVDYIERMQREASGIRSPFSDDNHTTSEKYNFDAMTSSIEDTTTSISKKNINRNRKGEESNNYQDEMNISLLSNLPAKSINFKDLPLKYSPSLNQNGSNKFQKSPITEEPFQYDDSQADIDEIISDSDDEIDLLYDPALNCYYDPKTCTYYELNLS